MANPSRQTANLGFSLAEMLLFIVVVSIAFATMVPVFTRTSRESVTPVEQIRAVKLAQSKLDEILALKFDENSPSGGIPACGSTTGVACAGITADSDYDDVGDFNGFTDSATHSPYVIATTVTNDGSTIGLSNDQARLVTVTVRRGSGSPLIVLSAYKVNF